MKKIGMIVAVEIQAVLDKYGAQLKESQQCGFRVLEVSAPNYEMVIVSSGAGEIAAAAATQFLISAHHVDLIVNFGVVGGLTPAMAKTKASIVEKVVHYDYDVSQIDNVLPGQYEAYPDRYIPVTPSLLKKALALRPELVPVVCASGDKFVGSAEGKIALHETYGADICEMEAAGIVLTCNRNHVPCMLIKIVSDGITGGAEEFRETKDATAAMCLDIISAVIDDL